MFRFLTGRREAPAPTPAQVPLRCSFCGKSQQEVRKLVAGPNVYICDECIVLCFSILEENAVGEERSTFFLEALTSHLMVVSDEAERARLFAAALALAAGNPDALRRIVGACFDAGRHELAIEASERIDASARRLGDDLDVAVARYELGDYEEARTDLESLVPESDVDRALVELNLIATRLRVEQNLDVIRLERMRGALDGIERTLDERYRAPIAGNRAECLLRLGQPAAAEAALAPLVASNPRAFHALLMGDAKLALGERALALEWYGRAAETARGPFAEEARRRLSRASSDPYR